VIQGIVPNAELAASTGPFGLAYAKMFNPAVGWIIMALAVIACVGSLLGWQFTVAQTGKAAADDRMFPALFSRINRRGAPVTGMIVLDIVQTLLALTTISPTLNEQFQALVSLSVVTNVIPYIVALSALFVMMRNAGVSGSKYNLTAAIALIAMIYSTYAVYASGGTAVMGGVLVMCVGYIIWGLISPRFLAVNTVADRVVTQPVTLPLSQEVRHAV
jgi:putrescine:ornithine antiporter